MNLVGKVNLFVKKNAAAFALKIHGYNVIDHNQSLQVFEGSFEFCRLQRSKYITINGTKSSREYPFSAYVFDRKERVGVSRIFKVLGINIKYTNYFVSPDGDIRIVD